LKNENRPKSYLEAKICKFKLDDPKILPESVTNG